jgi:thiamine-phosphate pyrophosphorylase
MRLIVISPPEDIPDEPETVCRVLERSSATFHLRKPGQADGQLADYLKQIPARHHPRIMVHGHVGLFSRFSLKGIHFSERERVENLQCLRQLRRELPGCRISSAFHRIADIPENDGLFDYLFLSPIFDSISKPGHHAAFDHAFLRRFLSHTNHRVIALGGVDVQRAATVASLGFKGLAVLGAVWQTASPLKAAVGLSAVCRDLHGMRSAIP